MNDREFELRQRAIRLFLNVRLSDLARATGVSAQKISDSERGLCELSAADQRLVTNFLRSRVAAVLEGEEMDHENSTRRLADKLCALYADATQESDKNFAEILQSLTPRELRAVREELARRVVYDRAHRQHQSLLDFPAFLEKVLSRT